MAALAILVTACGGGGDSGAEELAQQREIAAARHDGAERARQVEKLSREVHQLRSDREATVAAPAPSGRPSSDVGENLSDWPGGSAYSAMLGAFSSEANARARQREASERGLDAGVLYSSEFSSLRPGYWVVFSGSFGSVDEAAARASRARSLGYSDSYPRFVSP